MKAFAAMVFAAATVVFVPVAAESGAALAAVEAALVAELVVAAAALPSA